MGKKQQLIVLDMGIDTHQEPVVYMRDDCHICLAEGFMASSRVLVQSGNQHIIATLNVVAQHVLPVQHIGFSSVALQRLDVVSGAKVQVKHAPLVLSTSAVRKKIYGHELSDEEIRAIVADIRAHRYSDIEIASFLCVCAGHNLSANEIVSLTRAMVDCGKRLSWPNHKRLFDKHCVGGLPGNRTTPLVVAIASAAGLVIPKSSSRAITSPAGTADTMEMLMTVELSLEEIQHVVDKTGACLVWGGAVNLSPIDEMLIRIESALNLDGEGQLIASVLSKKIAAGSTHVLIDIPVGDTAKIRTQADAERLVDLFTDVGTALGLEMRCIISDGSHPIGRGIGPAEEARDVLAVLQGLEQAPKDLRQRALMLSAQLLDFANGEGIDKAVQTATEILDSGQAWLQFQRIADAQGARKPIPEANYHGTQYAKRSGFVRSIDNRRLARLAKLAGAPKERGAGLRLHVDVGDSVEKGMPLFTLFTDTLGERDYALGYFHDNRDLFDIGVG
jgi:thymidine phosphorylase